MRVGLVEEEEKLVPDHYNDSVVRYQLNQLDHEFSHFSSL